MMGQAEHSVITTCAYCGVGCGFKAEVKGQEVVRMVPWKDGQANRGHACVKGRFAWGYTTHKERVLKRSEEHTSELKSLMRISYAVFCLKKKKQTHPRTQHI